jgi:hypothetical protein
MSDDHRRTTVEVVGTIFYALVGLHGGNAEHEAADYIREALSTDTIRDADAKEILSGIVRIADASPAPPSPRYVREHGNVLRLIK